MKRILTSLFVICFCTVGLFSQTKIRHIKTFPSDCSISFNSNLNNFIKNMEQCGIKLIEKSHGYAEMFQENDKYSIDYNIHTIFYIDMVYCMYMTIKIKDKSEDIDRYFYAFREYIEKNYYFSNIKNKSPYNFVYQMHDGNSIEIQLFSAKHLFMMEGMEEEWIEIILYDEYNRNIYDYLNDIVKEQRNKFNKIPNNHE
jgi:hypothetical protein